MVILRLALVLYKIMVILHHNLKLNSNSACTKKIPSCINEKSDFKWLKQKSKQSNRQT